MMQYQKTINLLDNVSNQSAKFRTKNLAETNNESRGIYPVTSQIKFKQQCCSLVLVIKVTRIYLLKKI